MSETLIFSEFMEFPFAPTVLKKVLQTIYIITDKINRSLKELDEDLSGNLRLQGYSEFRYYFFKLIVKLLFYVAMG